MFKINMVLLGGVLAVGLTVGYLAAGNNSLSTGGANPGEKSIAYWVAPMDPNYRREGPGKSPMGMDLIPVYEGDEPGSTSEEGLIEVSAAMRNSLGVRSAPVEKVDLASVVKTVGYVGYNEDKTSHVHVREKGWIEKLLIRSEGIAVEHGDLLFELFSREIAAATYDFIRERQQRDTLGTRGGKAKLKALGMSEDQIRGMEISGIADEKIKVFAPQKGIVVNLSVGEGMFIDPAKTVLTLTDLTSVWVIADVFESQADRISIGMDAKAYLPQNPNDAWVGKVDFIYPELDPDTRTLRVRLQFDNLDHTLRPNMFVNVELKGATRSGVLSVPGEAVIRDGGVDRVIVDRSEGRFKAVAVKIGLQALGRIEILKGLEEGDKVVVSSQFLLDSESNLTGALARLSSPGDEVEDQPIIVKGSLLEMVEPGKVSAAHEPIPALGWPAMTMQFALLDGVREIDASLLGKPVQFEVAKGDDGMYGIRSIVLAGPQAWGKGVVNALQENGAINVTHEPIPAIGWPGMTMDLGVKDGVSLVGVSVGAVIRFGLGKGPDGMFRIEAIEILSGEKS